jgi:hypothetical protein
MPNLSSQWADALDPIVRKWWFQGFARRSSLINTLFNVQTSNRSTEEVSGIGAISPDAWLNYEKSNVISEADFNQGYKQTFTHKEYPLDFSIERKLMDDSKHNEILRIPQQMGDSAALRRELDAASVFNNAFSGSFTGADAVALCSDSHPYGPDKTGSVQDNNFALALNKTNLATVREAMMAFTDDNGEIAAVTPNAILVPPELEDEALVITRSMNDPDSGNNAINPQSGRFQVIVWHYLTDATAWFVLDTNLMKMGGLEWYDRAALSVKLRDGDDRTVRAWWRAYMRYSYGWSDWRWCAGSNT